MTKLQKHGVGFLSLGLLCAALAGCKDDNSTTTSPPATPPAAPAAATPDSPDTAPAAATAPSATDDTGAAPPTPPDAPPAPAAAGTQQDAPAAGKRVSVRRVSFELPEGWSEGPARQMRLATLTDGAGEIAISAFPADADGNPAGGLVANVNRFLSQVQLPGVSTDAEAQKFITEVDVAGKKARVLDLKGEQSRNLIAMVPVDDQLYYFRMTGANDVVDSRRAAFDRILQSIQVE